ncbi:MAG: serine/threonine protein kinase, partial [Verrucomicrobiae bacterium]|nr:serine/threonine protein kinase [Verrucomicrobiae bacterium]
MNASVPSSCPRCGGPRDALAQGLCPACLAAQWLAPDRHDETVSPDPPDAMPGRWLGGYELLEELGRGGMGVVFRARQPGLGREVAVKLLRDAALAGGTERRRFQAEAASAARLNHPHIVAIHQVGTADGRPFLVMELVAGHNLAELTRDGPLSARQAADLTAQLADAVQHAHARGVLHRDLKPSNVLLDAAGAPRLTDFGLARPLDTDSSITVPGQVLGTPGYLAPEQARGAAGAGPPADVYGLGALLFHLLTGRAPFVAASAAEALAQVLNEEPLSPHLLNPAVPPDVAAVCLRCLRKEPGKRYASAAA